MKAVVYHSFDHALWPALESQYERIFHGFVENFNSWGIQVVQLTTKGKPHYGNETLEYDLDPFNCMLNREITFCDYVKNHMSDVCLFTEPDARLFEMFPPLEGDLALLWRGKPGVEITPSFRLAKKTALPFFEMTLRNMEGKRPDWHGDSAAWGETWREIGCPTKDLEWNGLRIELRAYKDYSQHGSKYLRHYKYTSKVQLA